MGKYSGLCDISCDEGEEIGIAPDLGSLPDESI